MTIVVAIVLALGALAFTLFIRPQDIPEPVPVSPTQHLEDRKQAIYENLRDLQFEYRLGKLSDEDYLQIKQGLQKELAVVLTEMEAITRTEGKAPQSALPKTPPSTRKLGTVCPHCGAKFPQALKYCGECGRAIA